MRSASLTYPLKFRITDICSVLIFHFLTIYRVAVGFYYPDTHYISGIRYQYAAASVSTFVVSTSSLFE